VRVVLDTNVLVSAMTLPGGRGDETLRAAIHGEHRLVLSRGIIDELLGVLARKFARDAEELARVAVFLADIADLVEPAPGPGPLADPADNHVLACAVEGKAEVVVTGDRAMLSLGAHRRVRILTISSFLEERASE
jgi:putative PIN family toxin of toxin-antitoxin system